MSSNRDGLPILVAAASGRFERRPLRRLPFDETQGEDWLQQVLDDVPSVLPVCEIDERLELPLFSLGREVSTDAGPIDNLFISKNGYLVVVETKLFRNPEARRQVVAQLLDYASHARAWRYTDLNELSAKQRAGSSLYEVVNPEGMSEAEWIDRVNENLEAGRMTLLVVGDGIRSEAETLVDAVSGHPNFQFRLALVELRVFATNDAERIIVPATLLKTQEIERAVVTIRRGPRDTSTETHADVEISTPSRSQKGKKRSVLSEQAFLSALREYEDGERYARVAENLLGLVKPPLQVVWASRSFTVKASDPGGSGMLLSLLAVPLEGDAFFYAPWLRDQLRKLWNDEAAAKTIVDLELELLCAFGAKFGRSRENGAFDLLVLEGREGAFVDGLCKVAAEIGRVGKRFADS